jgi:hypothetical protein
LIIPRSSRAKSRPVRAYRFDRRNDCWLTSPITRCCWRGILRRKSSSGKQIFNNAADDSLCRFRSPKSCRFKHNQSQKTAHLSGGRNSVCGPLKGTGRHKNRSTSLGFFLRSEFQCTIAPIHRESNRCQRRSARRSNEPILS